MLKFEFAVNMFICKEGATCPLTHDILCSDSVSCLLVFSLLPLFFCRDDLRNLIIKRIGADNLLDKISFISKSEFFTAAVKSPEVVSKTIITAFCLLFNLFCFLFVCFIREKSHLVARLFKRIGQSVN